METPNNIRAENALLGAIFLDSNILDDLTIMPEDFYRAGNRLIFESMRRLHSDGIAIDTVSVITDMKAKGTLHDAGGVAAITEISDAITTVNAKHNAKLIMDCSKRRRIMQIARETLDDAENLETVSEILSKAENKLSKISTDGLKSVYASKDIARVFSEWIAERMQNVDAGIKTGIPRLDKITHGFQPTDLIFLAARPSMGKTAICTNWIMHAVHRDKAVAFFSLEMSMQQITARIVSFETGVEAGKIINPATMADEDLLKVDTCLKYIAKSNLVIDDTAAVTVNEIAAKARAIKRKSGLDIIFIDYLQLIRGDRSENRTQEVGEITRDLKRLAKELTVPVVCLSQLSRGVESRQDKRPMLSDLRDSGEIEQNCDLCLMLYREEYYKKDTDNKTTELILAKNRNGELGTIKLFFAKEYQRFAEIDATEPEDYGKKVKKNESVAFD